MPLPTPKPQPENSDVMLGLLHAVDADERVTQRSLSTELGIALGLVNAYLKRCIKKGLIKVQEAPRRRYAYYLTPKGFAEKSRLTADYLSASFVFMKRVKATCSVALNEAENRGWQRIVLIGASEISEITVLGAHEHTVEIVAVYDPGTRRTSFAGLPVWRHIDLEHAPVDGGILTVTQAQGRWLEKAQTLLGAEGVIVPDFLNTKTRPVRQTEPDGATDD